MPCERMDIMRLICDDDNLIRWPDADIVEKARGEL